jgi:hypothetical protein
VYYFDIICFCVCFTCGLSIVCIYICAVSVLATLLLIQHVNKMELNYYYYYYYYYCYYYYYYKVVQI